MGYLFKKLIFLIVFSINWLLSVIVILEGLFMTYFSVGKVIYFAISTIILLLYLYSCRCKECGKFFSIRKIEVSRSGSQDIMVKTEVNTYNNQRDIIGTQEQYIPGRRNFYTARYVCKNCGYAFYKEFAKDSKNT